MGGGFADGESNLKKVKNYLSIKNNSIFLLTDLD
jgi:hypothetical protein